MTEGFGKSLLTLLGTAFAGLLLYEAVGLSRPARLVPLAVLAPTLALLLFQLALDFVPGIEGRYRKLERADVLGIRRIRERARGAKEPGVSEAEGESHRRSAESGVLLWAALLPVSIYLLGLLHALPAYTLLYLRLRSGEGWRLSLAVAAVIYALLYGVFVSALGLRLYEGLLPGWMGV